MLKLDQRNVKLGGWSSCVVEVIEGPPCGGVVGYCAVCGVYGRGNASYRAGYAHYCIPKERKYYNGCDNAGGNRHKHPVPCGRDQFYLMHVRSGIICYYAAYQDRNVEYEEVVA